MTRLLAAPRHCSKMRIGVSMKCYGFRGAKMDKWLFLVRLVHPPGLTSVVLQGPKGMRKPSQQLVRKCLPNLLGHHRIPIADNLLEAEAHGTHDILAAGIQGMLGSMVSAAYLENHGSIVDRARTHTFNARFRSGSISLSFGSPMSPGLIVSKFSSPGDLPH